MDNQLNLFWFRRDLRINDNMGLNACIGLRKRYALIVIPDEDLLSKSSPSSRGVLFYKTAVKHLSEEINTMGSELNILCGKPLEVFRELCLKNRINAVYFNDDYEPYAVKRDQQIESFLRHQNIQVNRFKDTVLLDYHRVLKKDGTPYKKFTPYYKKWVLIQKENSHSAERLETVSLNSGKKCDLKEFQETGEPCDELFNQFFKEKIDKYAMLKDYPVYNQTSRFSKYLRFGIMSIRDIFNRANLLVNDGSLEKDIRISAESFIRQLAWRDFYFQLLYHYPEIVDHAFKSKYDALQWENDPILFRSWCEGKTGFPFVDAGMRQLNKEGWMHNRLRMLTASFLVKDLLIDWRWGEKYFQQKLIDYDLALNNGGWQWCASTGTDSQPYFRIFNPFTQSEKYDPDGIFIRQYVPELRNVEGKYIHRPFQMSEEKQKQYGCILGKDYPFPIVDHSIRSKQAIALYRML